VSPSKTCPPFSPSPNQSSRYRSYMASARCHTPSPPSRYRTRTSSKRAYGHTRSIMTSAKNHMANAQPRCYSNTSYFPFAPDHEHHGGTITAVGSHGAMQTVFHGRLQ
jgi:hypothetical protein